MVNGIKTRAGIAPSNKALPFSVTTSEVEEYLQKRVDAMVKASQGKVKGCSVKVYSTESGRNFIPFVVVLPTDIITNKTKQTDNDMEYIFNQKNEDTNVILDQAYYKLFSSYTFDKNDEEAFFSDNWRRVMGVYKNTSYTLKKLRTPKVTTFGNTKVILFMIDPLRVFHDMVVSEDDKRDFLIDINNIKKIETGKFRYDFKREISDSKKGKKYQKTIIEELNYRMKGGRA